MKSIILSADEVRATLDGRKSQLRRVVKPQPFSNGIIYDRELGDIVCHDDYLAPSAMLLRAGSKKHPYNSTQDEWTRLCPYGQPGDLLAVKETWAARFEYDKCAPREIHETASLFYAADKEAESHPGHGCRRSAATMPQWASRITLEVLSVRVERLQSIQPGDAYKDLLSIESEKVNKRPLFTPAYAVAWDSTPQGKRHPWSSNPWVWCVEYKVVTK